MKKPDPNSTLAARADLFKALGHPVRLLILNLIRAKPRHGEELAAILTLNPATISHHLALLTRAGVLQAHKDQYYQTYALIPSALDHTLTELVNLSKPGLTDHMAEDAYRQKVLRTFLKQGRLTAIPAQLKKRAIILEKIAEEFEPGRLYTEADVNHILVEFHDDVASLRRGLIEHRLLERKQGIYQRVEINGSIPNGNTGMIA